MIGKPEWFTTRKFGWGLGVKTKEGLIYIAAIIAIALILAALPIDGTIKLAAIGIVIVVAILDTLHMMLQVYSRLDEREQKHQMLAETNAAYVGVICLSLYLLYLVVDTGLRNSAPDPLVIMPVAAVLILMSLAKGGTLMYLWRGGY